jgi:hypothetical protein
MRLSPAAGSRADRIGGCPSMHSPSTSPTDSDNSGVALILQGSAAIATPSLTAPPCVGEQWG